MFCTTCSVESGPTLFCHVCDSYLPVPRCGVKAGIARRFVAIVFDLLLWSVPLVIVFLWIVPITERDDPGSIPALALACFAGLLIEIAALRGLAFGQTVGKLFLGLRVVDKRNGRVPGFGRMLLRETIGKWVSTCFLGLGNFWAIWDRDGQAWHDKIAGTVVIHEFEGILFADAQMRPRAFWPWSIVFGVFLLIFAANVPSLAAGANPEKPVLAPIVDRRQPSEAPGQLISAPAETTKNLAIASGRESSVTAPEPPSAEDRVAITETIANWATAMAHNDPHESASFYADHIDRYFRQRDVANGYVQTEKQASLDNGHRISNFSVGQLAFESTSMTTVEVSLIKTWTESSPDDLEPITRSTHSRLWLTKIDGDWKITGEQDLV